MADDYGKQNGGPRDPRQAQRPPGGGPEKRPSAFERWRSPILWALVVLLGLFLFQTFLQDSNVHKVPLSQFNTAIGNQEFSKVVVSENWVKGFPKAEKPAKASEGAKPEAKAPAGGAPESKGPTMPGLASSQETPQPWMATKPSNDSQIFKLLDESGTPYSYEQPSSFGSLFWIWIVPIGLAILLWSFFMRRMSSGVGQGPQGLMAFGKTKARVHMEPDTNVTFKDVAGIDEAVEELEEIVGFLQKPEKYRRLGGKIPKGVLLVGPPGTGKTLLARAVAGEAGVPFLSLSGSEFVEMFVGVGAARVRDLFQTAQARAPAIIFIDELDALAKARNAGGMLGGHDEREQTLNQLLSEMDGFDPRVGLIVLAATNRPEILDQALLRPGRFDRQVLVDRPDKRGRYEILKIHVREVKLSDKVDLQEIAGRTPGFAGADLANVVNEAALLAARRNADAVEMRDFEEAIERVVAGLRKKNRRMNENEKRYVAYHEAGHALVGLTLPHADPVQKVSIIPHGLGALGYTLQMPLEDRYLLRVDELRDKMAGLLGGRAAEELKFGVVTTGASDDLKKATQIARVMVTEYGMSEAIGPLGLGGQRSQFLGGDDQPIFGEKTYSETTAQVIDAEVRRLVEEAADRARSVLRKRSDVLEKIAQHLLKHEVIDKEQLEAIAGPPVRPATGPGGNGGVTGGVDEEGKEATSASEEQPAGPSANGKDGHEVRADGSKADDGGADPAGGGTDRRAAGKRRDGDTQRESA